MLVRERFNHSPTKCWNSCELHDTKINWISFSSDLSHCLLHLTTFFGHFRKTLYDYLSYMLQFCFLLVDFMEVMKLLNMEHFWMVSPTWLAASLRVCPWSLTNLTLGHRCSWIFLTARVSSHVPSTIASITTTTIAAATITLVTTVTTAQITQISRHRQMD